MENLSLEKIKGVLDEYVLTFDEMIRVRGGDGDPIIIPTPPPIKI